MGIFEPMVSGEWMFISWSFLSFALWKLNHSRDRFSTMMMMMSVCLAIDPYDFGSAAAVKQINFSMDRLISVC